MKKSLFLGKAPTALSKKSRINKTGEILAIKSLKLEKERDGIPSTALREIALLKGLSHRNIVKIKDVLCKDYRKLSFVLEFVNQDLKKLVDDLDRFEYIPEYDLKSIVYQLLLGIAYCHANNVLHRDLKLNNILINEEGVVKITDFGLAKIFNDNSANTHEVVTLWYRAPEILLGDDCYTSAVDMWSIG